MPVSFKTVALSLFTNILNDCVNYWHELPLDSDYCESVTSQLQASIANHRHCLPVAHFCSYLISCDNTRR